MICPILTWWILWNPLSRPNPTIHPWMKISTLKPFSYVKSLSIFNESPWIQLPICLSDHFYEIFPWKPMKPVDIFRLYPIESQWFSHEHLYNIYLNPSKIYLNPRNLSWIPVSNPSKSLSIPSTAPTFLVLSTSRWPYSAASSKARAPVFLTLSSWRR